MTILSIPSTTEASLMVLADIEAVEFSNLLDPATVTFLNTQCDGIQIRNDVIFRGSTQPNLVVVNGGSVDASGWQFETFNSHYDTITFNGSSAADTITGSSKADSISGNQGDDILSGGNGADLISGQRGSDIITGGRGADELLGGKRNDTFIYTDAAELAAGETIDGGGGADDAISIAGDGLYQFNLAVVSNVERLRYEDNGGTGAAAQLAPDMLGHIGFSVIESNNRTDTLTVEGVVVDLSAVVFENWTRNDVINITGTAASDILTGSDEDDHFFITAGVDVMMGNNGSDVFVVNDSLPSGTIIDGGGSNQDVLDMTGATVMPAFNIFELRFTSIQSVEIVKMSLLANAFTAIDDASFQDVLTVVGRSAAASGMSSLAIYGASMDYSGLAFEDWNDNDQISLVGSPTSDDIITGTSVDDVITPRAGMDIIDGGDGNDTLYGQEDDDTISGSDGDDKIIGGTGRDVLNGGNGADGFDYYDITESEAGTQRDIIEDFTSGEDQLTFVNMSTPVFSYIGEDPFTAIGDTEARIRLINQSNITIVEIDVDGDGTRDMQIELTGLVTLTADDFNIV